MITTKPKNIDAYIAGFPEGTQKILEQIRDLIKKLAPDAEEAISYGIPAFMQNNTYVVYFAGYKNHIGMYPIPKGDDAFKIEISRFKMGKGSIQFPLDKPMPLNLINKIVKFSIKDNVERAEKKKK